MFGFFIYDVIHVYSFNYYNVRSIKYCYSYDAKQNYYTLYCQVYSRKKLLWEKRFEFNLKNEIK